MQKEGICVLDEACLSKAKTDALSTPNHLLGQVQEVGSEILENERDEIPIAMRKGHA